MILKANHLGHILQVKKSEICNNVSGRYFEMVDGNLDNLIDMVALDLFSFKINSQYLQIRV